MKGSLKRLLALLIVLLAILLGVASLFTRSRWLTVFSWGVMALSLTLALAALVQSDRRQFQADPGRLHRRIRLDVAGLLLSTAAAVLAGREVLRLVPGNAASAGGSVLLTWCSASWRALPPRPWCSSSSAGRHAACRRPERVRGNPDRQAEVVAAQFNAAEKVIDAQIAANQDSQWLGSQGLPMYYPTQAALVAAYDVAREAEKKAKEQEALNDAYQSFKQADQQSMQEYEAYQGEQEQEKHRQKDVDQSSKPVDSSSWWNKLKEKVSSFVDEKIVQPVQYFGYVMESDPNPKGNLFGQGGITVC